MTQQVARRNGNSINALVRNARVRERFDELLGSKSPGFISSIISVVNGNNQLQQCDPNQVIASAAIAASLDLPIDPNLGFAYIVPYKGRPQFQMGYKGFIQLAMRTGQYKTINATHVYEGEIERFNRITGEIEISEDGPTSDEIVGYIAYFRLVNGFEKYEYMSVDDVKGHASRFSQSYRSGRNSPWQTDFDTMATKTVLKRLLSRYGVLSIEMQTALKSDQAVTDANGELEYADNPEGVIDGDYSVENDLNDRLNGGDDGEWPSEEEYQATITEMAEGDA